MQQEVVKENKMGVMPENKLLINIALPIMISMFVQALYNIVDSMFVARIDDGLASGAAGTAALVAVGMAFPFQMLLIAVGTGTGVGMNALLSKALGAKDYGKVQKAANNGLFLMGISFVVFLLVGIFLSEPLIKSQGGEGLALEYGTQYLTIVCAGSFGLFTQMIFERMLQSTGKTLYSMIAQGTGAIINIILDPIFIFGYCGMPEMKVAGAALATVIGQICAGIIALLLNAKKNKEIHISFKNFKPEWKIIKRIYAVGIPSIFMQAIGSFMTYSINKVLTGLNPDSVAVFTVYFKLQSLFFMPIFGLCNGMVPIVAFNFGAKKRSRVVKTIKISMIYAFVFAAIGFLLFEFIPETLLKLFDTGDDSLIVLGVPALRKIGTHYLAAWFCITIGSVFQALGNGLYSLIISIARQLGILLPAVYLLAWLGGLDLIWWSYPLAEVMSLIVSVYFLYRINKKVISKIPNE